MDILEKLAASARIRVAQCKKQLPLSELQARALALSAQTGFPFEQALVTPEMSFIFEVKRASPSKGVIAQDFPYLGIAEAYEAAGASAISVLTEPDYFLGDDTYLQEIARAVHLPVLRKDFTVDAYQIYQAKLLGASAVLLICALLKEPQLKEYIEIAHSLGLSALVETHDETEIAMALKTGARMIGVNNRDLRTFAVSLQTTVRLRPLVPPGIIFVSESGINSSDDLRVLKDRGVDAVLIGEALMRAPDKRAALTALKGDVP